MRARIVRFCRIATLGLMTGAVAAILPGAVVEHDVDTVVQAASAQQAAPVDPNVIVNPELFQGLRFRSVGPHRGGRVTAIAGVRRHPCTFYMGATGGGVWKTVDCGILWEPISDGQIDTGSIGAIAVSESNPDIVWVGTGSAAIRSNVIIGRGVYKSTDAGRTWKLIALRNAGQIGAVIIHPFNPDIVWVAALGSPYGPNDERGVFKTSDGGKSWTRVLFVNRETGARVIAIDPSNPNQLYAGMYRAFRKGWDIISGGPATDGGIYKSVDGGASWAKVSAGLPQRLIGKIDIDVARSRPSVVYAMVEAPGAEGGLYRSDDAGTTWALVNNSQRLRARPFYFHYVDVNPKNENEVWVNELSLWKSIDAGKSFAEVATPHGDNHGIWFNPDNPSIAIQCNDGGANVTLDGGTSWSSILNQPTGEFYMVAVDEQFPYRLYAPQQDNSTVVVPSLPTVAWGLDSPLQIWGQASGCETGQIWPRPDGKIVFGACKGELGRYSVVSGQEQHYWVYPQNRYGHNPKDIKFRFPRQTVVYVSPHDPGVIYQASHVLHRSVDDGKTWETISPDLTANEPDKQVTPGTPITRDITGEEVYSSIYSMVESRLEPGVIWVGANDGPVHVTRDNGKTWKDVTPKDLPPGGRVQTIEDSPYRKGSAYIAVYRYLREHDLQPYIYMTSDYGATWMKLTTGTNGIPIDHPTRVVREDPSQEGLLYAGTEFGLFTSFDNGAHWQTFQMNLPSTPVTDIKVHHKDLVLSTMGRGLWSMDNVTPLHQLAGRHVAIMRTEAYLFQPREAYRMRYAASGGRADQPEYPPPGVYLDYYLAGEPASDVALEILDSKGAVVRSLTSASPVGGGGAAPQASGRSDARAASALPKREWHNRFLWDLCYGDSKKTMAAAEDGERAGGPLVMPGTYTVKLTVGEWTQSRTLDVKIDPRVAADGVTLADLQEQLDLSLKVRDATTEARALAARIAEARDRAAADATKTRALQALLDRVVTANIVYPQPKLIDQLRNITRMIGQADQRPGRDAYDRLGDLMKEMAAIQAELKKLGV
ncbi:MAG: hypothetical protein NTV05_12900 [Acidobacteria bacterium]|nr:hypothetical protein [Acidobacteriota bacterium]